jgi:hypothetical protein
MKDKIEYFHFECKGMGNRYFKVDWENNKVIQIVLEKGNKNAAIHCVGIYYISINSFRGTYHWRLNLTKREFKYTTANQFQAAYKKIIDTLNICIAKEDNGFQKVWDDREVHIEKDRITVSTKFDIFNERMKKDPDDGTLTFKCT